MNTKLLNTNIANINSGESASLNSQIHRAEYNKLTLDKFSQWYTYENQITLGFPLLRKYENIIRANLIRIDLDKKFHYRPEYLSYDLYGSTDLWYILMFVNKMTTVTEFNTEKVLVPRGNLINTISSLNIDEDTEYNSHENPMSIKKNFLKKLNEPSIELIKQEDHNVVPWMSLPNISSKMDVIDSTRFFYSDYESNRGWLLDELGERVPTIKLTPEGLTSVPSVFFKEGYTKTLRGRIKLLGNTPYSFNSYMNGFATIKIRNENTNEELVSLERKHLYPEAMLINDMRSANNSNNVSGVGTSIRYDEGIQGKYINHLDTESLVLDPTDTKNNIYTIETIAFKANDTRDILNASRLKDYENVFFNLEYVNDLSDSNIIGFNYIVSINYTDGSKNISEIGNKDDLYNSDGEISYLKGSALISRGKNIKDITISTRIEVKPNTSSISIKNTFYSMEMTGLIDEDIITPFEVKEDSWYNVEINYTYKLIDQITNSKVYKDMSFAGLYFDPTISQLKRNNKIDHGKPADFQDDGEVNEGIPIDISNPYGVGDTDKYTMLFSNSLNLPSKYIIDFSITHKTSSQGGGVGFVVDFDRANNTGYMFWISSTVQGNTSIPTFSRDDDTGAIIMPSGFYELDDLYGESKFIFEGDNSLSLKVNNYYEIPTEGTTLRLIKRNNRIKVYMMNNSTNEFDLSESILDIEDIENFHKNGEIALIAAYAEMGLTIHNYSTWDFISEDSEEW